MSQEVSLPPGTKTLTLSGSFCIATQETDNLAHDLLSFDMLDMLDGENVISRIGTLSNRDGSRGCSFKPIVISKVPLPGAPGAAALRLRATQDGPNLRTTFYFDELKLTVGCTP